QKRKEQRGQNQSSFGFYFDGNTPAARRKGSSIASEIRTSVTETRDHHKYNRRGEETG
ncbi:unnamed protein product, partial [Linum tenue]